MGDQKSILCVEDDSDACELAASVLKEFEVITAASKADAVEKVKLRNYSLILVDYFLPDGTGEEFTKHVRIFDKRTPILFVTGSADFSETQARTIGAQGTLKKGRPDFVNELRQRALDLSR